MKLPFEDESFDGVYAIEATCHAPQREGVYSEIFRVLKPGRVFACYEWCLTDLYDPESEYHRLIKKQIEEGDGLPDMCTPDKVLSALKEAGFEVLESRDMAKDTNPQGISWYHPLTPSWNVLSQRFQFTKFGMALTKSMLWVLEAFRLAPAGTSKVQGMLQKGGIGCAAGGVTGTFTPMFLAVVRKPAVKK
jgi:sterol 24-C-methyltransferase